MMLVEVPCEVAILISSFLSLKNKKKLKVVCKSFYNLIDIKNEASKAISKAIKTFISRKEHRIITGLYRLMSLLPYFSVASPFCESIVNSRRVIRFSEAFIYSINLGRIIRISETHWDIQQQYKNKHRETHSLTLDKVIQYLNKIEAKKIYKITIEISGKSLTYEINQ